MPANRFWFVPLQDRAFTQHAKEPTRAGLPNAFVVLTAEDEIRTQGENHLGPKRSRRAVRLARQDAGSDPALF